MTGNILFRCADNCIREKSMSEQRGISQLVIGIRFNAVLDVVKVGIPTQQNQVGHLHKKTVR